jgi:hypothetical protein
MIYLRPGVMLYYSSKDITMSSVSLSADVGRTRRCRNIYTYRPRPALLVGGLLLMGAAVFIFFTLASVIGASPFSG